jgi:acetylornithine deacetylase
LPRAAQLPGIFAELDPDRLVANLRDMIAIPSVNPFDEEPRAGFREQEMAAFYGDHMSDLGLEVGSCEVAPGRPNVWGILKGRGDAPSLMLCGHLDTVGIEDYPDAFAARVEDGRVYGRGSCDMKAGLAAYLEVARLIRRADISLAGDLVVAGLADEEHQMIGSRHLGKHGPWADYGIIGEPSDLTICPAHKGQVGLHIRTFGKAVHSGRPELGVNAIEAMSHVIEALRGYGDELKTRGAHQLCGHGRVSPNVISGGTIVSTVPDFCQMEVDRRTLPGETKEDVLREYRALLDGLAASSSAFRYEISGPTMDIPPLDISIDSPVVQSVVRAYEGILGDEGTVGAFFGGTDAPNLGFPTLVFGPGSVAQAHSRNEFVEIDDLIAATRIYLWSALDLLAPQFLARLDGDR